jgi:transglutaminase-like putative cysteine protease
VAGWLYPREGHVWAEVLVEGSGWHAVDPTSGAGCDERYVPYLTSEDGMMPIVYTSEVKVFRLR